MRRTRTAATGFWRDFQVFILRGNVVDLAIAVIIGGAFGKIVDAFVTWIMSMVLNPLLTQAGVSQLKNLPFGLGDLVVAIVNFLVIALVVFMMIRVLGQFHRQQAEETPPDPGVDAQERLIAALNHLSDQMEHR